MTNTWPRWIDETSLGVFDPNSGIRRSVGNLGVSSSPAFLPDWWINGMDCWMAHLGRSQMLTPSPYVAEYGDQDNTSLILDYDMQDPFDDNVSRLWTNEVHGFAQ